MRHSKKKNRKKQRTITFKSILFTNRKNKKMSKTIKIETIQVNRFNTLIKKNMINNVNLYKCPVKRKKRRCRKIAKTKCIRPTRVAGIVFLEESFKKLSATNQFQSAPSQNTSLSKSNMYMISNHSINTTVEVQIEISPNNHDFSMDTSSIIVKPKQNFVVIPLRFAKFTRVSFRSLEEGETAEIDIFYQTQDQLSGACKKKKTLNNPMKEFLAG